MRWPGSCRPPATCSTWCHDRYRFAVGFAAGLLRGMTSLQPSSQSAETFRRLRDDYPDLLALCDGATDTLDLPRFDFPELVRRPLGKRNSAHPGRPLGGHPVHLGVYRLAAGATPRPGASWRRTARAEAIALGLDRTPHVLVGTVPVQAQQLLESTFLLALHGGAASGRQPATRRTSPRAGRVPLQPPCW